MSAVPQRIDRYVIERELGRGSFGAVYKARHSVIGRDVALKVLHADRATSPSVLERFLGEARAVAAIGSPHIVQMYDAGLTADGKAFLAMELLDGEDLSQLLERRGRLSAAEAIEIAREVCLALAAAHRAGVVHRDLKPANIFLARDPAGGVHAKVLDFGVSKITRPEGEELTMTGTMLGTPHYMAPEQLSNSRGVDGRADLYAVGTVLFEMLSLSLPYDGETLASLIAAKMSDAPRSLSQLVPDVPGPLATVVLRALSWDPRARFATAEEMEAALAQARPRASAPAPSASDPAMARTELARSQPSHPSQPIFGASGASTAVRPPSHPHPSHPPQTAPSHPPSGLAPAGSVAQSSIVALPGIVNASQGTVAGTTEPPFRRILTFLGVALVAVAALAMVALTLVAVALAYLGMNLAGSSSPESESAAPMVPTTPTLPSPSLPSPSLPSPSLPSPSLPPPSLPSPVPSPSSEAPSTGALVPSVATPSVAAPSSSGASRIRIVPTPLSMDAETITRVVREARPPIEGCAVPSGYESTFIVTRMASGGATTHRMPHPDPNPAASACIEDAFRIATLGLPAGLGVAHFRVVVP